MTIANENVFVSGAGDDVTVTFNLTNLHFFTSADLSVYLRNDTSGAVTLQTEGAGNDYTVTGTDTSSGSVTFNSAPATGETVIVIRAPDFLQGTDYPTDGKFPSASHEDALDLLTELTLYLKYVMSRSIRWEDASDAQDVTIPGGTVSKFLRLDAAGDLELAEGFSFFVQAAEPTAADSKHGDLWVDSDSTNLDLYQYVSGVWTDTTVNMKGDAGATGATASGALLDYAFATSLSGDPGSGKVAFDNATPGSMTTMRISETDRNNNAKGSVLDFLDDSTSTTKGFGTAVNVADPSQTLFFKLTGDQTDQGTYRDFPVGSAVGTLPDADAVLVITIMPAGDAGSTNTPDDTVVACTTANVDLAGGGLANGTTHDGVTVATDELVLVVSQTDPAENGVYVVPASGAASRDNDFDTYDEHPGKLISVQEGTLFADTLWLCTSDMGGTLGTTAINFTQQGPAATESVAGIAQLATTAEAQTGTDDTTIITPAKLQDVTATETRAGVQENATVAEIDAGTADKTVTPGNFKTSDFGTVVVPIQIFDDSEDCATGDGAGDIWFRVPSMLDGWDLTGVAASVQTAGTTGTMDIQIHNVDNSLDMLSTKLTIDSAEKDSSTAATPAVINTSNNHVNTGDQIRIDVDAVQTTAAKGLQVELQFRLP